MSHLRHKLPHRTTPVARELQIPQIPARYGKSSTNLFGHRPQGIRGERGAKPRTLIALARNSQDADIARSAVGNRTERQSGEPGYYRLFLGVTHCLTPRSNAISNDARTGYKQLSHCIERPVHAQHP